MKTPRDLLFTRHQSATPKLDELRHAVIAQLPSPARQNPAEPSVNLFLRLWQELVLPCRHTWSALATVWVLIVLINFTQHDNINSATGRPVQPGQVMMSFQAQQRLLNEVLADRTTPTEADQPRNFSPKPRTAISPTAAL